ncbi:MAG: tRNA 2-thiouridine synthesizing protein [Pseudomonadota bacterium]|nr:tRNA 2-thiouridine synthesizing protein [Pseudomonadota bacterium]
MPNFSVEVDARNESCPMPVMKTKKALKGMKSGEVLHVIATDPASAQDINTLLEALNDKLLETSRNGGEFHFYIQKG